MSKELQESLTQEDPEKDEQERPVPVIVTNSDQSIKHQFEIPRDMKQLTETCISEQVVKEMNEQYPKLTVEIEKIEFEDANEELNPISMLTEAVYKIDLLIFFHSTWMN